MNKFNLANAHGLASPETPGTKTKLKKQAKQAKRRALGKAIEAAGHHKRELATGAVRAGDFPIGAAATVNELDADPHPLLARLREREPVSWLPALHCWLVTDYELVLPAMRDAVTFTVDDERFSTRQVIGPHAHLRRRRARAQPRSVRAPVRLAEVRARSLRSSKPRRSG